MLLRQSIGSVVNTSRNECFSCIMYICIFTVVRIICNHLSCHLHTVSISHIVVYFSLCLSRLMGSTGFGTDRSVILIYTATNKQFKVSLGKCLLWVQHCDWVCLCCREKKSSGKCQYVKWQKAGLCLLHASHNEFFLSCLPIFPLYRETLANKLNINMPIKMVSRCLPKKVLRSAMLT